MNIKNFATMLLKEIENSGLPVTEIKRLQTDKGLFGIATSDNSQFLLKIAKHDAMNESTLLERVLKFIPAICIPHLARYLRQIQVT